MIQAMELRLQADDRQGASSRGRRRYGYPPPARRRAPGVDEVAVPGADQRARRGRREDRRRADGRSSIPVVYSALISGAECADHLKVDVPIRTDEGGRIL
jgi:hypothetical protein